MDRIRRQSQGHSLDGTVRIITEYGASPETTEEEVKAAFVETGIGEVIEASGAF